MLTPFNSLDFDGRESNYFYDNRLVYYKKKKKKTFLPTFFHAFSIKSFLTSLFAFWKYYLKVSTY